MCTGTLGHQKGAIQLRLYMGEISFLYIDCQDPGAEGRDGKELALELLRNASSYGLNVARIYAHTADDEHPFMVRLPAPRQGLDTQDSCLTSCEG